MELVFVVVHDLDYYVDLFLKAKQSTTKPATWAWYERVLRYYKQSTLHLPGWPPTPAHLDAFMATFHTKKLADNSRNNYYRALHSFLEWCQERGYLHDNPIQYVDKPRPSKLLPKDIREIELVKLFETVKANIAPELSQSKLAEGWLACRDLAVFSLALDGGIRIGELDDLLLDDVDLLYSQVYVHSDKDYEDRAIALSDVAAANLARWLARRIELGAPPEIRHVFVSLYNKKNFGPFTHSGMRRALKVWQERAGVQRSKFNHLRHTYAIYSLRNNADLLDVRDQLGHASIKTTAIYTRIVNKGRSERHQKTSPLKNLTQGPKFDKM